MSLHHAVLGFLAIGPTSRSGLVAVFQQSVGHFWTAEVGDFKHSLERCAQTGLVSEDLEPSGERSDDPAYRLTVRGQVVLEEWLVSAAESYPLREPFLLRVFFAGQLQPAKIGLLIDRHIEATSRQLSELQKIAAEIGQQFSRDELPFEDLLRLSTLDRGIAFAETELAWAETLRDEVARNGPQQDHAEAG